MKKKIILLLITILCIITGCTKNNPHEKSFVTDEMNDTLNSIKKIDEKGALYEMNYSYDYYNDTIKTLLNNALASVKSGCSSFTTYNTDDDFLFCRNYDYRHKDNLGNYTGLNVVLNLAPAGKLKSINVVDAYWLNQEEYYSKALDDGVTDTSLMMLAPYMCVDGMNEEGVIASLLVVDLKDGEEYTNQNTGKPRVTHSVLLRYIIDNAYNLEDAVAIAKSYDVYSSSNQDLHMFVADKNGNSAVFEWRNQELYVTYTNAVTNFYVGFTDGEDVYNSDGTIKELYAEITNTINNYKYGYGHGYHRFNGIISTLERYIKSNTNLYGIRNSKMTYDEALDILRIVSQNPGTESTSFTQYSAIYNLNDLSVNYYVQRDYTKVYTFNLK